MTPNLILGRSLETRFHENERGMLVDVSGFICDFRKDPLSGRYPFDHQSLQEMAEGEGAVVTNVVRDGRGSFVRFSTGPISWTVVGWKPESDVYLCEPK